MCVYKYVIKINLYMYTHIYTYILVHDTSASKLPKSRVIRGFRVGVFKYSIIIMGTLQGILLVLLGPNNPKDMSPWSHNCDSECQPYQLHPRNPCHNSPSNCDSLAAGSGLQDSTCKSQGKAERCRCMHSLFLCWKLPNAEIAPSMFN